MRLGFNISTIVVPRIVGAAAASLQIVWSVWTGLWNSKTQTWENYK